jgi:hypothetical protein
VYYNLFLIGSADKIINTMRKLFLLYFLFLSCFAFSQSVKPTKADRKQERKNIDSLFIVYSLPVNVGLAKDFFNEELKDSITGIFKKKGYECPGYPAVGNLIKEKMLDFLPSPVTEREKYKETMEKVAKDKNYYFTLMGLADPFLQSIELSSEKNDAGESFINVKRQNFPNGRKSRIWTFKYDDSEPVQNLAIRIVDVLINKKQSQ